MEPVDPPRDLGVPLGGGRHPQHRVADDCGPADVAAGIARPSATCCTTLTGKWNLEDYLGHDAYIVAASAIVYNALGRLQDDDAMQASFRQYVERPATLCIPLLLATFSLGNGTTVYRPDFFQVPTDPWLTAYWIILCTTLLYLLGYGARAMFILRRDPRSRRIANIYLVASVSGMLACAVRITTACLPPLQTPLGAMLVWLFACTCGIVFALAAAHSWRIKTRWLTRARY